LFHIGAASFWEDELFAVYYPRAGLHFMWTKGLSLEPNPPLFFTLVLFWERLVGNSETAVRLLSALCSLLAIPLVYALGRELGASRTTSLIGALLFAIAPTPVFYAQAARSYAFALLPAGCILLGLARCLRIGMTPANLAIYAAGALVGCYTHTTFALLIAACNLAALYWIVTSPSGRQWRDAARWLFANAVVAVLALPVAFGSIAVMSAQRWQTPQSVTRYEIADVFSELVAGPAAPVRFPGLELAALAFAAAALVVLLGLLSKRQVMVLVVVPCLFFVLTLLLSIASHQPVLVARVFSWTSMPLCLLLSYAVVSTRYQPAVRAAVALAFLGGLALQLAKAADSTEPWRTMLPQVEPELARANMVVLLPYTSPGAFIQYAPLVGHVRVLQNDSADTSENTFMPQLLGTPKVSRDEVLRRISEQQNIWVIGQYIAPELKRLLQQAPEPRRRIEHTCPNHKLCFLAIQW
jgi:mannosyltransferase